jgi:hypothetical protein
MVNDVGHLAMTGFAVPAPTASTAISSLISHWTRRENGQSFLQPERSLSMLRKI